MRKNHPAYSWRQMHDLSGTKGKNFQPLAGAVQHITKDTYSMVLYAWFGGKYDGQSYYIKNISIDSPCYNVGVFGATAGATVRNVVLYSDNSSVIQRNTSASSWDRQYNGTPQDVKDYICSYTLGGSIGVAYEYNGEKTGEISNCAIAGYVIEDNSKNALHTARRSDGRRSDRRF